MTPEALEVLRRLIAEELDAALPRLAAAVVDALRARGALRSRAGLLTLEQAGELLGGTPTETIRRWIWEGRIKAYKPGKHPLVRESELLSLVEANETTAKRVARRRTARTPLPG